SPVRPTPDARTARARITAGLLPRIRKALGRESEGPARTANPRLVPAAGSADLRSDGAAKRKGKHRMTYDDRDRDMRKDPDLGDDTLPENREHGNEAVGAGAGAIGGALVGGAVAGPPGALVGAVIGGAGGAAAGESTEGNDEAGSTAGGAAGAVTGAVVGGAIAGPPGALVGGAVGAGAGAGTGDQVEEEAEEAGNVHRDYTT